METYVSNMPLWAIMLFIASFLYSIAFIANPAKRAALHAGMTSRKARNIQIGIFAFYFVYLSYVSILSLKGVFHVNSLPPKVMVWAGLPLFIILFGFIGNTSLFKQLLRAVTLESLVALHVFRAVGVFFIILYFYHLLPAAFAVSAETGDLLTAILALPVAKMVSKAKPLWKTAVVAWNIFGMLDIINVLIIASIYAVNTMAAGPRGGLEEMTLFPFAWFPAFAPATILFLHVTVFRKMYQITKNTQNIHLSAELTA
jgi:hypothetical protein